MGFRAGLAIVLMAMLSVTAAPSHGQPAAARAANLESVVTFFVPAAPLQDLIVDGIATAYRTRLASHAGYAQLEAAYPGISEAMSAAVVQVVHRAAPDLIARLRSDAEAYWDARLTDAEAAAFAAFANDASITEPMRNGIDYRPGDTAISGLERSAEGTDSARLDRVQAQFAATPAGRRLLPVASAYQAAMAERLQGEGVTVTRAALAAAHRAANDFVRRRSPGADLPYPDEPAEP
jgi:hypothetical protein